METRFYLTSACRRFGYITNTYTRPEARNRGLGSRLLKEVREWAVREDLELLIVWPSDRAAPFYQREGFSQRTEIMQLLLRPYYTDT